MRIYINRFTVGKTAMAPLASLIDPEVASLSISNNPYEKLSLPDLTAARAAWPAPTFLSLAGATQLTPGIKLIKKNQSGSDELQAFSIAAGSVGIGETIFSDGGAGNVNVTPVFMLPYASGKITDASSSDLNAFDLLRFRAGLTTDRPSAYPDAVLTQTPDGAIASYQAVTTRGASGEYPYYQNTRILPQNSPDFVNVKAVDAIAVKVEPIFAGSAAAVINAALSGAITTAGALGLSVALEVDNRLLADATSPANDTYIYIPVSVSRSASILTAIGTASSLLTTAPVTRVGFPTTTYQGAIAAIIIPIAAFANATDKTLTVEPATFAAAIGTELRDLALSQSAGVLSSAALTSAAKVVVSLNELPTGDLLSPSAAAAPTPNYTA